MLWLDSIYPPEKEGQPGAARGPCSQDSGVPDETVANFPDAYVASLEYCPTHLIGMSTNVCLTARSSGPTSSSAPSALPTTSKCSVRAWSLASSSQRQVSPGKQAGLQWSQRSTVVDGGAGSNQIEAVSLYILRVLALVVVMFHDTSVHSARHQDSVDISSKRSSTSRSLHWLESATFV